MKRSISEKSRDKRDKKNSKSKSKSKDKKVKAKKNKEEEKKEEVILAPIVYTQGTFICIRSLANPKLFDVGRVQQDYRQGENGVRVNYYERSLQEQRGARSSQFNLDNVRPFEDIDHQRVVHVITLCKNQQQKKKNIGIPQQQVKIQKKEIKTTSKLLRGQIKLNREREKQVKQQRKEEQKEKEKQDRRVERAQARENRKDEREAQEGGNKRQKVEDGEEQINTHIKEEGENEKPKKKRQQKAIAKKRTKAVVRKIKEPIPLREDVEIPDIIPSKEANDDNPFLTCCQTCSNRNCLRAVAINSIDLFHQCIQSKAYITSLIEHLSPEQRYSTLEKAANMNRLGILEMLLQENKPENEYRMKKKGAQIAKYETGEVGEMAFGVKVRKVQMMRGNRQGNNAFLEDSKHDHNTPKDYLLNNNYCIGKIFSHDCVQIETLQVFSFCLGQEIFLQFVDKALQTIMQHGCYQALVGLFEILGKDQDPRNSFFNKIFYELLTVDRLEGFTINKEDLNEVLQNPKSRIAHVAALNPSGMGLLFLKQEGQNIDMTYQNQSTAHFAAVCNTPKNLQILIENEIDLHDEDANKKTPLIWAIESKKPAQNIRTILEDLSNKSQKDHKENHKKMAIHYVCQYGVNSEEVLELMLEHKAKFSQVGGWDKYTPLIYATAYGNFEVAKFLLEKVPRLNIDKGDKYKRTPLIMAVRNGHANVAALLIKHNANIDLPDTSGNTPLHHAAAYGWLECVQLLIKYGADPSPENAWKSTPISIAMQKNHLAIVKELITAEDINVDSKDDEGRTLLALIMANINIETPDFVELLLVKKQADPNAQDSKGRTPLYHLVSNMSQKKRGLFQDHDALEFRIVKMLLASGANVNIKSKDGKSPFTLSFESGITELLKLFGGNIDLNQDPSLFFAFSKNSILKTKVHKLLIDCMEAKTVEDEAINYVNDNGFTPFLYYINEAIPLENQLKCVVQEMVNKKMKNIENDSILEYAEKHNPVFLNFTKEAKKIYQEEIIKPFISFLQKLLDFGANPNAYVLKYKQWREAENNQAVSQISQSTQAQAAVNARRPAEKDQYISQELGLCNAIHLLLDYKATKSLLKFILRIVGIELNQVNFQSMTPFFKLVKTKDIKNDKYYKFFFEKLLETGKVDINAPDQFGCSAFWYFYNNNRLEDAFFLVDKGANINHIDNYGIFALKRELFQNNYEMMKRLLEKGADPNQTDEFGRTCLHLACNMIEKRDIKAVLELLIKHKADVNVVDMKKRTPMHYMFIRKNRRQDIHHYEPMGNGLEILINKQTLNYIHINHQDINGKTLMHYAAQRGSVKSLEYFIDLLGLENIGFEIVDKWMNTPLSVAINCKQYNFVEQLLSHELHIKPKGFIYDEPKPRAQPQQINQFQWGNQQIEDEQSDLEFMEVQVQDIFQNIVKKHNKDEALNIFRYIIRNQIQNLEKLFIEKGYDKIQMVIDYICEGQIGKLFQVIDQYFKEQIGAKGSILIQKNVKEQNLVHVLARNAHLIKDIGESTRFFKQLIQEGVNPKETDKKGRTALHFAVRSGNIHFIKYLIDVEKFDVNQTDNKGANAINTLCKGDRILKADHKILKYLLSVGGNPDQLYEEAMYSSCNKEEEQKEGYRTTSVIHAIRHESKERENIRAILKALLLHANPSQQDSDKRDPFMYIAMRNHFNTFHFILDHIQEQQKNLNSIKKDNTDIFGKSVIHYIVNPLEFGSYENEEMLRHAIEVGFVHNLQDEFGKTPYQYGCLQSSGKMRKIFEELKLVENVVEKDQEMQLDDLLAQQQEQIIDYEKDAQLFLQEIQMQIDPHNFVPCDQSGKFNDDCVVINWKILTWWRLFILQNAISARQIKRPSYFINQMGKNRRRRCILKNTIQYT